MTFFDALSLSFETKQERFERRQLAWHKAQMEIEEYKRNSPYGGDYKKAEAAMTNKLMALYGTQS